MAYATTEELAIFVEKELGHASNPSSQRDDVLSQLDRSHKIILAGGGFLNYTEGGKRLRDDVVLAFARSAQPKIITLLPTIETLGVTTTQNSAAITFNSAPDVSVQGWNFQVTGTDTVYRIQAHTTGATTATLDSVYVDDAVDAEICSVFKTDYTVGSNDILRLVGPLRIAGDIPTINLTDRDEMFERVPSDGFTLCTPEFAAVTNESNGTYTLKFSSSSNEYIRVEADWIAIPTTLTISPAVNPIIPTQFREMLAHMTLYFMQIRNDDDRATAHYKIAQDMFAELADWNAKMYAQGDEDYGRPIFVKRFGR